MKLNKPALISLFLAIIFLASSWSLFKPGLFPVHDFLHAARISQMHLSLTEGHFPVRWSPDFGYGYGMPLFQFYAPLPYYFGAMLYSLGISAVDAVRMLFLITNLVTLLGAYKLGKTLFGVHAGLITAAAITLAPYRAVNLFVRGAVSEAWGIMALPWILYAGIGVINKKPNSWITLVISLVVLLLSHNITTLMFVPFSLIFLLTYWLVNTKNPRRNMSIKIKSLLNIAGSYALGFSIAAYYTIPAFFEKNYTIVEKAILGGYFDFRLHFLYIRQFFQENWQYGGSVYGPEDEMSFFLGFGQLIAVAMLTAITGYRLLRFLKQQKRLNLSKITKSFSLVKSELWVAITSGLLFIVALYMSLFKTQFIWEALTFLEFIQFPWRWLAVAIIFLGIAIGLIPKLIENSFNKQVVSMSVVIIIIITSWQYFQPDSYLKNPEDLYYTDRMLIRQRSSGLLPDYIPVQMNQSEKLPIPETDQLLFCQIDDSCDFDYEILVHRGHEALVRINADQESVITFVVADFPGWKAEVAGIRVEKLVSDAGLLQVNVDPGEVLIGIRLTNTPIRNLADTLSLIGLLVFGALLLNRFINIQSNKTS